MEPILQPQHLPYIRRDRSAAPAETDPTAERQPRVLEVETKFLRLRQPVTLGERIASQPNGGGLWAEHEHHTDSCGSRFTLPLHDSPGGRRFHAHRSRQLFSIS